MSLGGETSLLQDSTVKEEAPSTLLEIFIPWTISSAIQNMGFQSEETESSFFKLKHDYQLRQILTNLGMITKLAESPYALRAYVTLDTELQPDFPRRLPDLLESKQAPLQHIIIFWHHFSVLWISQLSECTRRHSDHLLWVCI